MLLKSILTAFVAVTNIFLFLYSSYTVVLALFGQKKLKTSPMPLPQNRFAFLIAARNEAGVLGQLLASLKKQNYPADLFNIYVVPNNCTDQTETVARQAGARVLLPASLIRSKGDVLEFAFKKLAQTGDYDAICVIDADNLVHPDFLLAMNRELVAGNDLVQGYRDSKNPHDNGLSGSYSIYFWLINRFINRPRHNLGLPLPLGGSGFAIKTDLIRKMPQLDFLTMTEDMELSIFAQLAGAKSSWAADALIYDEQPLSYSQSWRQRRRWTSGMYQIGSLYSRPLLQQVKKTGRLAGLDLIMLYSSALVQVLAFFGMAGSFLLSLLSLTSHSLSLLTFVAIQLSSIGLGWIFVSLVAFTTVVLERKLKPGIWRGIFSFWFFLISWIPINLCCLFYKPASWQQIEHKRSIRYQDLNI